MNKQAVALAADSAGTVGTEKAAKVYLSENKLFMLSKYQPVGIMVYGASEFMMMPMEIIIKQYRRALGNKHFGALADYAADFIRFLNEKDNDLIPDTVQDDYFQGVVESFLTGLRQAWGEAQKTTQPLSGFLADISAGTANLPDLPGAGEQAQAHLLDRFGPKIDAIIEKLFGSIPDPELQTLRKICSLVFLKSLPLRSAVTGIVIAGYGDNDVFPAVESHKLYGKVDGILQYEKDTYKSDRVTYENDAAITAFAQGHDVATFMEGIDPSFRENLLDYIDETMRNRTNRMVSRLPGVPADQKQRIINMLGRNADWLMQTLVKKIQSEQSVHHTSPIIENVRHLSKDQLAEMAESLVSITSFKRKSSMLPQTVGGPIDVAVISKGDGFIWIKRKHYFDPKYNPHFFENYYEN